MIQAYYRIGTGIARVDLGPETELPAGLLWCDLYEPSTEERRRIEAAFRLQLPSREEMREIEPSARLYAEGEALYMTATVLWRADDPQPASDPFTFVLHPSALITLRYVDPSPVNSYCQRILRQGSAAAAPEELVVGLLESFIARFADVLEKVDGELDYLSRAIFDERESTRRRREGERRDLQAIMRALGRDEDLSSTARESLLSLGRLARFLEPQLELPPRKLSRELKGRLRVLRSDMLSLAEHAAFEIAKVAFLLNATLGMINVEQNRIIKIFSVVAVAFLPPTLIASIYGMNFHFMPELDWTWGYPVAIGLMLASALLPFWYFRRKGWL